jgi:hypothetical protein
MMKRLRSVPPYVLGTVSPAEAATSVNVTLSDEAPWRDEMTVDRIAIAKAIDTRSATNRFYQRHRLP